MNSLEFIRKRLKDILIERHLSMRQMSLTAGLHHAFVSNIISGRTQKRVDAQSLRAILDVLKMSEDEFYERGSRPLGDPAAPYSQIPLYGVIPAGYPQWGEGSPSPDEYIYGSSEDVRAGAFALRVRGDSMAPRYLHGDILVLRPLQIHVPVKDPTKPIPRATFDALAGRAVAVLVNNEATLKILEVVPRDEDYELALKPINKAYPTITIRPTDEAQFQGEVYKMIREE